MTERPLEPLFRPYHLGPLALPNRIVMAPMTRWRCGPGGVPHPLAAEYYSQRASAGLIVTEGSQISAEGQGYPDTPGIYSEEQVAGWAEVTRRVHDAGGRIFLQLWHTGRIDYVSKKLGLPIPVAPSPLPASEVRMPIDGVPTAPLEPRALRAEEIPGIVDDYRSAARNALRAGFDGVEIHAASGYLLDQFAKSGMNRRNDAYGGSMENRSRLMLEVAAAVAAEVGADRTGIRISPVNPSNDSFDEDPQALFELIAAGLDDLSLLYLHVVEGTSMGDRSEPAFDYARLRAIFRGTYIGANGISAEKAASELRDGRADLVAFGRSFIANPDLVDRLRTGAPMSELDKSTIFGGGAQGYTDYPVADMAAGAG
ncbi:alkene reductase [Stakelama sp. CBK3Z-3]|uniref:Alkene reductase n=1 Tax=Stakelama flava TaxID=2860338 RepID=A0ABS6XQ64_9SPHN|nr:alkene reductase [Stakelama flava]MBW4332321.1 alkene reductase [Stakelama flava]